MNDGEIMEAEEAVEPQEEQVELPIEQIMEDAPSEPSNDNAQEEAVQEEKPETKMIPLSVAQKLREKKKELELQLQWERQEREKLLQMQQTKASPPEEDESRFESATKQDLKTYQDETVRVIEERLWIKQNPEKFEEVNELLPQFLKQRPNLASAINQASNRYEEAYTLMNALSPKQQKDLKVAAQPKRAAPNAPTSVPKAAALNEAVDVMNMSDSEFSAWRASKKKRR